MVCNQFCVRLLEQFGTVWNSSKRVLNWTKVFCPFCECSILDDVIR